MEPFTDFLHETDSRDEVFHQKTSVTLHDDTSDDHRMSSDPKKRWKPSKVQLEILKVHFQETQYPNSVEKAHIAERLRTETGAKVTPNQIGRWFQHHREREGRFTSTKRTCYQKFSKSHQNYLISYFQTNAYPTTSDMQQLATKFAVSSSKIENWFKHYRRALAHKGKFEIKSRKYFTAREKSQLEKLYSVTPRPTREGYREIAKDMSCSLLQIKNWFANKRKKQKYLFQEQISKLKFAKGNTDEEQCSETAVALKTDDEETGRRTPQRTSNMPPPTAFPSFGAALFNPEPIDTQRILLFNLLYYQRMTSPNQSPFTLPGPTVQLLNSLLAHGRP
eukprot:TRINITY_DN14289_c0_g1_i2.p1 TRINITY_DN14289_c0_g1~~TRINITY_DN14289_c0_g1_i2.p1  ORF type:complete len:335 (-),score=45.89 TRINITY_DN14289_c0_g1_i2:97-1101(-)